MRVAGAVKRVSRGPEARRAVNTAVQSPAALEFETGRLAARCLDDSDEVLFCDLYTDPETMRFIGEPLTREQAQRSFRRTLDSCRVETPERAFFRVVEKSTRLAAGICAITRINAARNSVEVGVMLKSAFRARGFSRECLEALITRTLAVFPIAEVWIQYRPGHVAMERLAWSLGFSPEGGPGTGETGIGNWSVRLRRSS